MHKLKNVGQLDKFQCPDRCECLSHTKILHPLLVATMCGMANKTMCTVIHLRKKSLSTGTVFVAMYFIMNDVTCSRSLGLDFRKILGRSYENLRKFLRLMKILGKTYDNADFRKILRKT